MLAPSGPTSFHETSGAVISQLPQNCRDKKQLPEQEKLWEYLELSYLSELVVHVRIKEPKESSVI